MYPKLDKKGKQKRTNIQSSLRVGMGREKWNLKGHGDDHRTRNFEKKRRKKEHSKVRARNKN